ncbi:hypothetical protein B296_00032029 [Ensete ventricosum]|uniref:Uncharacterized protein n=1 Tax=Ensete ventricosum TaxID=4639 RepID=A0A426YFV8_ENSVE|nr:hypothetical protein B296_00032029 [Ensete ventricosum]
MLWELAGSSLKGIGKLAGNTSEEDHKTRCKNVGGCWIGGKSPFEDSKAIRVWSSPKEDRTQTPVNLDEEDSKVDVSQDWD